MKFLYGLMKLNRLLRGHRLKYLAILTADLAHIRYTSLRFDPVYACNLRCRMCYFSNEQFCRERRGRFTRDEISRIAALFFPGALQLVIGCGAEPTLHPDFPWIIRTARSYRVPYTGVTTNGQLLTQAMIEDFVAYGLSEITISLHGIHRTTYEHFMRNARWERLWESLQIITQVKKRHSTNTPRLRFNYIANAENCAELSDFFTVFGDFSIDTLQVRPVMDLGSEAWPFRPVTDEYQTYTRVLDQLSEECCRRGVTLLANRVDPAHESENRATLIMEPVLRSILPGMVWQGDFDWKNESLRAYKKRIGWRRKLWRDAFTPEEQLVKNQHSLGYDIQL